MPDLKETFYNIEVALYRICNKEEKLTQQMRNLADQTDQVITEVRHLKELLAEVPLDQLQTLITAPASEPKPVQKEIEPAPISLLEPGPQVVLADANPTIYTEPVPEPSPPIIHPEILESQPHFSNEVGHFELDLGIKWLSRIGIVALLLGIAMALSYSFPSFPKEMKILTGFILTALLFFGGGKLYPSSPVLGRILQGGGLSVGYLSIFAMFFIPDVQLFQAGGVGIFLLFSYVGLVLSLAHKMNSQTVAILSLTFGYYTATYSESHITAFLSTAILSLGAVAVTRLHQDWKWLPKQICWVL